MTEIKVTKYDDVKVGDTAKVTRTITENDIQVFGDLSGDYNPIHFNEEWASKTLFKGRIAHGILTAASISTAIGMHLPGAGTIYLGQSMKFIRPVRIGDTITTLIEVLEKIDEKKHIRIKTICTNQDGKNVLEGEALVTIMEL